MDAGRGVCAGLGRMGEVARMSALVAFGFGLWVGIIGGALLMSLFIIAKGEPGD
jgi:hypothetical protein